MNLTLKILIFLPVCISSLLFSCVGKPEIVGQPDIVPCPKSVSMANKNISFEVTATGIESDSASAPFADVIKTDLYRLTGAYIGQKKSAQRIRMSVNPLLEEELYQVHVGNDEINITGGSYYAVSMGWTSVLQAATMEDGRFVVPVMEIKDQPDMKYRGLMLDLARQFHSHHVVKQMIDVCRWYKIRYMHLHLSDEGMIVFPSWKFPKVLSEGRFYTPDQLREMIAYANERGVTLVPELEGPGHSLVLRNGYPELFGPKKYDVIDVSDENAIESVKVLIGEMMESFSHSPYFHIGADEINLNILKTVPHVQQKLKTKGYKDVHDFYLEYLSELNRFIQSKGKQTLVWEGFDRDGSDQVKISKDIIVCVFETLFQRPDSLAKNGYQLINASWKPLYITQTRRWSPEKIYNWNYYTWENFWEKTPAAKAPIVLNENERKKILGAQLCAWEMPEEMEYPAISKRLAVVGERLWNTTATTDYRHFESKMLASESKLRRLIYPFAIIAEGLTESDYSGVYANRENYFSEKLTFSVNSRLPNTVLRYTTDRSFPTIESESMPEKLTIDQTTLLKMALYDSEGKLLSYYPVLFENRPLKLNFKGENHNDNNPDRCITFSDSVKVEVTMIPLKGSVHYTLDGSEPQVTSPVYTGEIPVSAPCGLRIRYYNEKGEASGEPYGYFLCPQKDWYELLRFNYKW